MDTRELRAILEQLVREFGQSIRRITYCGPDDIIVEAVNDSAEIVSATAVDDERVLNAWTKFLTHASDLAYFQTPTSTVFAIRLIGEHYLMIVHAGDISGMGIARLIARKFVSHAQL